MFLIIPDSSRCKSLYNNAFLTQTRQFLLAKFQHISVVTWYISAETLNKAPRYVKKWEKNAKIIWHLRAITLNFDIFIGPEKKRSKTVLSKQKFYADELFYGSKLFILIKAAEKYFTSFLSLSPRNRQFQCRENKLWFVV